MAKPTLPANSPYVYAILVDGVVRYIGKGRGARAEYHVKAARCINAKRARGEKVKAFKFHNRLAKALRSGASVTHRILKHFATDEAAFAYEVKQIAKRRGLWNTLEGGNGNTSEYARILAIKFWSKDRLLRMQKGLRRKRADPAFRAELSAKMSAAARIVSANPAVRLMRSKNSSRTTALRMADPKYRARISRSMKRAAKIREADPAYVERRAKGIAAKWADAEFRIRRSAQIVELQTGKPLPDETCRKISLKARGRPGANRGKKLSLQTREAISRAAKERYAKMTPADRKACVAHLAGLGNNSRWVENGDKQRAALRKKVSGAGNPMFGKPGSLLGRTGKDNPNFGAKRSEETKAKIAAGVALAHARVKKETGDAAFVWGYEKHAFKG
jgi:hypothetical protein